MIIILISQRLSKAVVRAAASRCMILPVDARRTGVRECVAPADTRTCCENDTRLAGGLAEGGPERRSKTMKESDPWR
jgi:hypothetical protein